MADTPKLMTIGRFSSLTRISVRMLRHYDAHGVLFPARVDDVTGYRSYAPAQLANAVLVRQLRDVGFGVPAIGALLAARSTSTYGDALTQQRDVIVDEVRAAQHRLDLIDRMREAHQKEQTMSTHSVTIEERAFAARRVASMRGTIPTYKDESQLWDRFMPELGRQQIAILGPCGALDHDEDYQEQNVDKEVFAPVPAGATAIEPVQVRDLPEQRAVCATLTGPYDLIGDACDQLVAWAAERGLSGTGGMRYIYINDVRTTPPEQLVTEIYLPVD
ncbi:MerR family transcriptional regulator [Demetria terragena]|uniref:MerR family transcriptional regulator n=1 Tax=Demetria terragena TaxID=63959 RepID=UPI00037DEBC2|nr:MerR family transcriptional regulator [Demetria terragena]